MTSLNIRFSVKSCLFGGLFAVVLASSGNAQSDLDDLSDEVAGLLTLSTYVGMGQFCKAYGIDFIQISERINSQVTGMLREQEPSLFPFWNLGFRSGSAGNVFSAQEREFLEVSKMSKEDTEALCGLAYRQTLDFSRFK